LLEGCYVRSALLSDVQLYEDYPSRYVADAARRHRWIRGDWQIASWLLSRVPGPDKQRLKNPFPHCPAGKYSTISDGAWYLSRFYFIHRRWVWSLTPVAWTTAMMAIFLTPPLCSIAMTIARRPPDISWRQHIDTIIPAARRHFAAVALELIVLPHEAYYHTDAILRVLWRLMISRRRLLEWTPFSNARSKNDGTLGASFRHLWPRPPWPVFYSSRLHGCIR